MSRELFFGIPFKALSPSVDFLSLQKRHWRNAPRVLTTFFVWKPILAQNGRVQAKKLAGSLAFSDSDANFA